MAEEQEQKAEKKDVKAAPKAEKAAPKAEKEAPQAEKAAPQADKAAAAAAPAAEGAPAEAGKPVKKAKGKGLKNVPVGVVHIQASFNNTIVTITDMKGAVISWSSAGRCGFKGSRRSTAYAATLVAQEAARQAVGQGMHEVEVRVQGPGAGRESAIRAIQAAGLGISCIRDVTPMPHNGCRAPKRRRV